jgi:pilus assembly protein CpaB
MLSRRGPILIVVSLLLAVGAAWVANRWLISQSEQRAATPGTVPVVTAATDIPFGTAIEAARHVAVIQMLEGTAPDGAYKTPEEVEGKVARAAILKGDILLPGRLTAAGEGNLLAMIVSPNMRAVSVRVNDVVGVAGFLLPGNRVDVVTAYRDGNQTKSDTVIQNVKVLAVDQTASTDKNEPVVVRAVTLEVTPEDAETLVLAEQRGVIQLALRNPSDEELVAVVTRSPAPTPAAAPAPAAAVAPKAKPRVKVGPPPPSEDVTVIRGTDVAREIPKK